MLGDNIYMYIYIILVLYLFYNSDSVKKKQKTDNTICKFKKILPKLIFGKKVP